MADALLLTSQFAAAAGFLALATALLVVRFNSRVNRAFAIYLLLQGMAILTLAGVRWASATDLGSALLRYLPYLTLPLPFVLLYFLAVYRSPQGGPAVRAMGIVALAGSIGVNVLYLVEPCQLFCTSGGGVTSGPLAPIYYATPLAQAVVAGWLAWTSTTGGLRGPAMRIVATAFAVLAFLEGSLIVTLFLEEGWGGFTTGFEANLWVRVQRSVGLLAFAAAAIAFVLLGRKAGSRVPLAVTAALAFATALLVSASGPGSTGGGGPTMSQLLVGAWRLLASALIAYALVRHRFLALDHALNFTVRKGTLATVLLATFFVVFQVIENLLDANLGLVAGGLATGAMLLSARPLERAGARLAKALVPRGQDPAVSSDDERLRLFREQAYMVWSDGMMGRKERLLLDNLRERLRIPLEEAVRIEREATLQAPAAAAKSANLST